MEDDFSKERQETLNKAKDAKEVIDLITTGSSMEPLLQSNSTVFIEFNHTKNIHVGDIIAFYDKYGASVHRCIKKKGENVLERGDGCNLWVKSNWINNKDIIGKMVYVEYENKRLVIESFRYRLYSFIIVVIGKFSNIIGYMKDRDTSNKQHVSLNKQNGVMTRFLNRLVRLLYNICIKYEVSE
jgi:signal peptidase I